MKATMRLTVLLASLLAVFTGTTKSSSTNNYLYNLDEDPYESDNVIDESKYSSIVTKITKLHESFTSSVVKPTEISKSTMESGFAKCGGVCSFLDKGKDKDKDKDKDSVLDNNVNDAELLTERRRLRHKSSSKTLFSSSLDSSSSSTSSTSSSTSSSSSSSSSTSSSSTPNIVFVLVDDWGYNDVGYRSSYLSWTTPTIDRLASEGIKLENYYTAYYCMPARRYLH